MKGGVRQLLELILLASELVSFIYLFLHLCIVLCTSTDEHTHTHMYVCFFFHSVFSYFL